MVCSHTRSVSKHPSDTHWTHTRALICAIKAQTNYTDACASLSLFAVNALCALGMLLVNVLLSLLGWLVAYPRRSRPLGGVLVALHLLASASTLSNSPLLFPADGCVVALPCLFGTVAATGLLTAYLVSLSYAPDRLAVAPPRVAVVRKTR